MISTLAFAIQRVSGGSGCCPLAAFSITGSVTVATVVVFWEQVVVVVTEKQAG
jgi:hypothetical protein